MERQVYRWSPRISEVTEVSVTGRREVGRLVVVLMVTSHRVGGQENLEKVTEMCLTGKSQLWSGAPPFPSSLGDYGKKD